MPSSMIFDLYTKFLMDMIAPKKEETRDSELPSHVEHYISHLLTVYEKAEAMGCFTEDIAHRYVTLYLQLGKLDEARKLAAKLCSGKLSDSVQLWLLRISVEIRCVTRNSFSPSKADMLSIFELLKCILTKVSALESESLWLMVCYQCSVIIAYLVSPMLPHFLILFYAAGIEILYESKTLF